MIVVGSQALVHTLGPIRKPKDLDIFASREELNQYIKTKKKIILKTEEVPHRNKVIVHCNFLIIECELTDESELNKKIHDRMLEDSPDGLHASLEWLYFLKMSHRYLKNSSHFMKTMMDIKFLRSTGVDMPVNSAELYKLREKETYTYNHPNLSVEKDKFFKKEETFYKYDHDTIHEAVAIGERPAYTYYIEDGEQVKCSKEKFFALDERTRLNGVLEEAYVLALERSLIPHKFIVEPHQAFNMALEKVCTSITSGWFREYAWENYFQVQKMFSENYVTKFKTALKENKILPFHQAEAIY